MVTVGTCVAFETTIRHTTLMPHYRLEPSIPVNSGHSGHYRTDQGIPGDKGNTIIVRFRNIGSRKSDIQTSVAESNTEILEWCGS